MPKDSPFYKQGTDIKTIHVGDNVILNDDAKFQIGDLTTNFLSNNTGLGRLELRFDSGNGFAIESGLGTEEFLFESNQVTFSQQLHMSQTQIVFLERVGDPAFIGNVGQIYTKDVSTITELFYEDSSGTITQLTGTGALENLWDRSGTNLRTHTAGDTVTLGDTAHARAGDAGLFKVLGGDNTGYNPTILVSAADGSGGGFSANMILDGDGVGGGDATYYLKNGNVTNFNVSTSGGPGGAVSYQVFNDRDGAGALNADFYTNSQAANIDSGSFNFFTGTVSGTGVRGDFNITAGNVLINFLTNKVFTIDKTPVTAVTPVSDSNKIAEFLTDGNATNFWFNTKSAAQGATNATFGFAVQGAITSALTYNVTDNYIALTNDGSNGAPTTGVIVLSSGEVVINSNANTDFPNAQLFVTRSDTGTTSSSEIGIIGEAAATASLVGVGVYGVGKTSSAEFGYGMWAQAKVNASTDSPAAVGFNAISTDTHASGSNIAISATASGSSINNISFSGTGDLVNIGRAAFSTASLSLEASAQVEIKSTTRGFLPPRMTTTQRDAIASPATGLTIFNTTTVQTESYTGTVWDVAPAPSSKNYVFAYDTTAQDLTTPGTFQSLNFGVNAQLNGWTHTVATGTFGCTQTGLYLVQYSAGYERVGAGDNVFEVRALFNGTEVAGSQISGDISVTNQNNRFANSFILSATTGQDLVIQFNGGDTDDQIAAAGGTATTPTSATITIIRIS